MPIIAILVLILDQWSKYIVRLNMREGQSILVIDNMLKITYVHNPGAAFGLMAYKTVFFIVVTLVVISIIAFYYRKVPREKFLLRLGLNLQVGGAIGNLIDRVRFGSVVDFIEVPYWPVFNIADSAIVIGVGFLLIEMLYSDFKNNRINKAGNGEGTEGGAGEGGNI